MAAKKYFSSTRIAMIALFSALAAVLYIFNFAMPFAFPEFLEFRFSDVPVLIGTFALGPLSGCVIVVMMVLIKLVCVSTSTMFVGDAADILVGFALVIPVGLIYQRRRTFRGALLAMAVGTACSVAVAVLANWLILVPFYVEFFYGGSWDSLIGMMTPLFPSCTKESFYNFYLWVSVLPFNLMRCLVAVCVTLPVYKRISRALDRLSEKLDPPAGEEAPQNRRRTAIVLAACACAVLVLTVLVLLRYFVWK